MRAKEFLNDEYNKNVFKRGFEIKSDFGKYTLVASPGRFLLHQKLTEPSEQFTIHVFYKNNKIGWVNFEIVEDHLEALDLYIDPKHRRKGLATAMYKFAKSLGNDIMPSSKQTALGKAFWAAKDPTKENQEESMVAIGERKKRRPKKTNKRVYGYGWYGIPSAVSDSGEGGGDGGMEEAVGDRKLFFSIKKNKNSFGINLSVNNKPAGTYQYNNLNNRHIADISPEFQNQGLGKLLVLKALETAHNLGMDFIEDESRTAAYDAVIDSLENSGYIVRDGDYLYMTLDGLEYLKSSTKQSLSEGKHQSEDLADVAHWLNTTPDQLSIQVSKDPINKFLPQIREMYSTFDENPEDSERTDRIFKLLKRGAQPLPIYVEASDPDLFVMEGRHRMVAFWLAGMKTIPVAYVSVKDKQGIAENFADGRKPGRKGLAKRMGVDCKQSVSKLRSIAKNSSGERQRMAHWCANMKSGKK